MRQSACVFILFFLMTSCGGTDLGDGVAIGGSVLNPILEQTEIPIVISTNPSSPDLSQTPAVVGTSEADAQIRIFSDSGCINSIGSGTSDSNGQFSIPVSSSLPGGTEQSYWVQATSPDKTVSDCSTTSVSYRTTAIRPGLAIFSGTETTAPATPLQVNQATAYPVAWSSSEFDSSYYSHSTSTNSNVITISQDGDYFVAATLPLIMTAGSLRPCVRMEVRVNGTLVTGAIGESSYIRFDGATGNFESSSHVAILLENLINGDEIEVYLQETAGDTGTEVVGISSVASLLIEAIDSSRSFFTATATRTVGSTNINTGASAFEWTEGRKDSGFTHDDVTNPEEIAVSAGEYVGYINVPINSSSDRTSPRVLVRLNGTLIAGGQASQGYARNDSGHNDTSIHWTGHFSANNGDVLTVTTSAEAGGGTVNVQAGQAATITLEKLSSSDGLISLRATQLTSGVDWNTGAGSTVAWTTSDEHDSNTFTHSTVGNPHEIQVNEPGDYMLIYNDSLTGSNDRVSPIIKVQVNGSDVAGAETKTHYMRNASGHNESSASLVFLLRNLSSTDVITLTSEQDVGAGVVTIVEDAKLLILKK